MYSYLYFLEWVFAAQTCRPWLKEICTACNPLNPVKGALIQYSMSQWGSGTTRPAAWYNVIQCDTKGTMVMQYWNSYPWIESQHVLIAPPPPPPPLLQLNSIQNTFSNFDRNIWQTGQIYFAFCKLNKYSLQIGQIKLANWTNTACSNRTTGIAPTSSSLLTIHFKQHHLLLSQLEKLSKKLSSGGPVFKKMIDYNWNQISRIWPNKVSNNFKSRYYKH